MARYHMRKKEMEITDESALNEIIRNGKYIIISMCRNNEPYIVTLSYGFDEASKTLYFHCGSKGVKIDFIRDNPLVCGTIINDMGYIKNNCEHQYTSVVMYGLMNVVESLEEKMHALNVLIEHLEEDPEPTKKSLLKDESIYNKVTVLKLKIEEMTGKKGQ